MEEKHGFDIKDLGLSSIKTEMSVKPIEYRNIGSYDFFDCRIVIKGDKSTGEYHLRPKQGVKSVQLMAILNGKIEGIETVAMASSETVPVDYPVYMKIESFMSNENIEELLKDVDQYFKGGQS